MNYQSSEIKRIGRKARRFQTRNKSLKTKFKIDLSDHPGICLLPANVGIFQPLKKAISNENL